MAPDLHRADPPVGAVQVGAVAFIFVFAVLCDPLIHRHCPAVVEALFSVALPTLTFWLLWPRRPCA